MLLADGRLPTGSHAHSAGLEAAVRWGDVVDVDTLRRFVVARLATQGRLDAAFAAASARAWVDSAPGDRAMRLRELGEEFDARTPSPHLREQSRTLGRHLVRAAASIVDDPASLRTACGGAPRPVVAGAVAAAVALPPEFAATMELHHLVAGTCGAAVKLLGLDPLAIVAVQAELAPSVDEYAVEAAHPTTPSQLVATTCARADLLAEWHANDGARMFAT